MAKKATARVVIPTNIKERLELAAKVYAKHVADGNASILKQVVGINWAVTGPTIATAKQLHEEAEGLKRQMENKYKQRDLLLQPIDEDLNLSTTNYKAVYAVNPKKLGEFGYTVDDTPRKKATKKTDS